LPAAVIFLFFGVEAVLSDDTTTSSETAYRSVWAKLYPETLRPEKPEQLSLMFRDFYAAAASTTLKVAETRWTQFRSRYGPVERDFEDAVHERFWFWAGQELKRCRFLIASDDAGAAEVETDLRFFAAQEEEEGLPQPSTTIPLHYREGFVPIPYAKSPIPNARQPLLRMTGLRAN
tara:strand:- start:950 stop:1477 length:528 start_codon:yes stop_codon:yes gene_type:complete